MRPDGDDGRDDQSPVVAARGGDVSCAKYLLDRRAPTFQPKSRMDLRGGTTLDDMLKERAALTEDDLRADGTITDGEDDDDGYDPPQPAPRPVKQLPPARSATRQGKGEDELRRSGVIYDPEDAPKPKPALHPDPKRPYDFGVGRYK